MKRINKNLETHVSLGKNNTLNNFRKNSIPLNKYNSPIKQENVEENKSEKIKEKNKFKFGKKKTKVENELSGEIELLKVVKLIKVVFAALIPSLTLLFSFLGIVILVSIVISPFLYLKEIKDNVGDNLERLGNFLTFNGWCTDEECNDKEEEVFYKKVDDVAKDYYNKKNVNLNTSLIISTLTYYNPFVSKDDLLDDDIDIEEYSSNYIDFKKSKKHVDVLADNMVVEKYRYYLCHEEEKEGEKQKICVSAILLEEGFTLPTSYCKYTSGKQNYGVLCDDYNKNIKYTVEKEKYWEIDLDKYRKYLKEEFIPKYFYNNFNSSNIDNVISEIFSRAEFYEEATTNKITFTKNAPINSTKIFVKDCTGMVTLEELTLNDYLKGVLYMQSTPNASLDYYKTLAIAAKNNLYSKTTSINSTPSYLNVSNCNTELVYCNVEKGCSFASDGTVISTSGIKLPLNDPILSETINTAISTTLAEMAVSDGKAAVSNSFTVSETKKLINSGSDYKSIIKYFYNADVTNVTLFSRSYPLETVYNHITSPFGWRVTPKKNCCNIHKGMDLAANADSPIYAIADGVVVTNGGSLANDYGYYVVLGHGGYDENKKTYEYYSLYAHQIRQSTYVSVGDSVSAGQQIGNVGSTGLSTGNHLHLEIYTKENGTKNPMNPYEYFEGVSFIGNPYSKYASQSDCTTLSGCKSCY